MMWRCLQLTNSTNVLDAFPKTTKLPDDMKLKFLRPHLCLYVSYVFMSLMSLYRASKNIWLLGEMQRKVRLISVGEQLGLVPGYCGTLVRIKGWFWGWEHGGGADLVRRDSERQAELS